MARETASTFSSDRVWQRSGEGHTMSKNAFMALVAFWTAFGIVASGISAYAAIVTHVTLGWPLLIAITVVSFAGIFVAMGSDNPVFSLLGYMLVAVPFGVLLGPVVALYTTASVVKVLFVTGSMTIGLGFLGAAIPVSLESWGGWLFGGLWVLLVGMFLMPIASFFGIPIEGAMRLWDWVGVVLFSGYIIYDLNRATRVMRTHDNAIDVAVAVYLDFVNLFIRLLELTGKKKD